MYFRSIKRTAGEFLPQKLTGHSAAELAVVLAIVGILAAAAVPAFNGVLNTTRQRLYSNALRDAVRTAREHADAEGKPTTLCPYSAAPGCGNDWSQGWSVFREKTKLGIDSSDKIAEKQLNTSLTRIFANRSQFVFAPQGTATNGSIFFCPSGADDAVVVVISNRGKTRLADTQSNESLPCD